MTDEPGRTESCACPGPMGVLVDPVVRASCRALSRARYPLRAAAEIPVGEGGALARALLRPRDFPLPTLRAALARFEQRLLAPPPPPIYDSPTAPLAPVPELLAGDAPACRAARMVYRQLCADPELVALGEARCRRVAFLRAYDFRALCEATLPTARYGDDPAALHAWAQCYAREYLASTRTAGPSARCEDAARIALHLARRISEGEGLHHDEAG